MVKKKAHRQATRARLDRGKDAAQNAAEDDPQGDQAPQRVEGDSGRLPPGDALAARVMVAIGQHQAQHDQGGAEQQARRIAIGTPISMPNVRAQRTTRISMSAQRYQCSDSGVARAGGGPISMLSATNSEVTAPPIGIGG